MFMILQLELVTLQSFGFYKMEAVKVRQKFWEFIFSMLLDHERIIHTAEL